MSGMSAGGRTTTALAAASSTQTRCLPSVQLTCDSATRSNLHQHGMY